MPTPRRLVRACLALAVLVGTTSVNVGTGTAGPIDDKRAEIFLLLREYDLRGRKRAEDNIFDLQRQLIDTTNRILDPRADPVDDVKIRFQFASKHAERIEYAVLTIDVIMLDD